MDSEPMSAEGTLEDGVCPDSLATPRAPPQDLTLLPGKGTCGPRRAMVSVGMMCDRVLWG